MSDIFDDTHRSAELEKIKFYESWLKDHPLRQNELTPRYFEDAEKILFYHSDHWGCNFSRHAIPLSSVYFEWEGVACTSENLFQAAKFARNNPEYAYRIATAPTPREAAKLGRDRTVKGLDPEWNSISLGVMVAVLNVKIDTHPEIENSLLETGDRVLIENTAHADYDDYIWGCGKRGDGKNLLGIAWMLVRDSLRVK